MSFDRVLEKYREIAFSERDKGDRFERLAQAYLQTDLKYAFRFKKIWLWKDFPAHRAGNLLFCRLNVKCQFNRFVYCRAGETLQSLPPWRL